jgi:ABC-type transport system substrate-binding protein
VHKESERIIGARQLLDGDAYETSYGAARVLEAYEGYWRHTPYIKRIIMKGIPEGATRLAMLKKGEADIAFALEGAVAEEVKRDPHLQLVDTRHASMQWLEFTEQWDPKSPWHDKRVRLAVNYALDRQAISEAACLGFCPPPAVIIPRVEAFIYSQGAYAYGGYPDIDALFKQQAVERDRTKREAILHRIQELTMERVMYAPIMDFRALVGVGPRVAEHAINALPVHPFPPLEEIRLK